MNETTSATPSAAAASGHAAKYTRNQPYMSKVLVNDRLTGPDSEKETIHIELELEEGMTYTPGDAVGIVPTNRDSAGGRRAASAGLYRLRSACWTTTR